MDNPTAHPEEVNAFVKSERGPYFVRRMKSRTRKLWGEWPEEKALHEADLKEVRYLIRKHYGGKASRSLEAKSGLVRVTIGHREVRARTLGDLLKKLPTTKG